MKAARPKIRTQWPNDSGRSRLYGSWVAKDLSICFQVMEGSHDFHLRCINVYVVG